MLHDARVANARASMLPVVQESVNANVLVPQVHQFQQRRRVGATSGDVGTQRPRFSISLRDSWPRRILMPRKPRLGVFRGIMNPSNETIKALAAATPSALSLSSTFEAMIIVGIIRHLVSRVLGHGERERCESCLRKRRREVRAGQLLDENRSAERSSIFQGNTRVNKT